MTITVTITRRTAILVLAAISALVFVATVAGCSQKQQEQFRDAPTIGHDKTAVELYDDADGFSNWAEKCDGHGNRVFVAFHGDSTYAAITAIKDSTCPVTKP
jgi:hypothetical protein